MTLGQLAHAFSQIPNQNQTDGQLGQILQNQQDRVVSCIEKTTPKRELVSEKTLVCICGAS